MLTTPTTCPWYIFNEIWLFLLHRYSQLCKRANSSTVWLPSCWLNISLCSVSHARFWMWRRRMDASYEDWRQKGVVSYVFGFFYYFLVIHGLHSFKSSYLHLLLISGNSVFICYLLLLFYPYGQSLILIQKKKTGWQSDMVWCYSSIKIWWM